MFWIYSSNFAPPPPKLLVGGGQKKIIYLTPRFISVYALVANVRFYVITWKFMNDKYIHNFIKLIPFRNITISLFIHSTFWLICFFPPHFLKASQSTLQHHIWCVVYQDVGTTRELDIRDNISQGYPLPRKNIYLCNCLVL